MYSAQDFYAFIQWVRSKEHEPSLEKPEQDENVAAVTDDRSKATDPYGWTAPGVTRERE